MSFKEINFHFIECPILDRGIVGGRNHTRIATWRDFSLRLNTLHMVAISLRSPFLILQFDTFAIPPNSLSSPPLPPSRTLRRNAPPFLSPLLSSVRGSPTSSEGWYATIACRGAGNVPKLWGRLFSLRRPLMYFFILYIRQLANGFSFPPFFDFVAYRWSDGTWVDAVIVGPLLPLFACTRRQM